MRERIPESLKVFRRSSSTGRMRCCSNATRLSTPAHCDQSEGRSGTRQRLITALCVCDKSHPLVSCCDVLQGSCSCLLGDGVNVALLQYSFVHLYYIGVPQPLFALRHPSNLSERAQILVFGLSGDKKKNDLILMHNGTNK